MLLYWMGVRTPGREPVGLLFSTIFCPRVLLPLAALVVGLAGVGLSCEVAGVWAWAVSRSAERARLLVRVGKVFMR
jgi:hypothetical protein